MHSPFAPRSPEDIATLLRTAPLAWLVSVDPAGEVLSSQLPLLVLPPEEGEMLLLGHMARTNPLVARLGERPRAAILFQGPNAYVSPSWYADRDSAPTWIYVNATLTADVTLREDLTDRALNLLVHQMEQGRPERWRVTEIAHRYAALRDRVIGFTAKVVKVDARFKLAQDEPPAVVRETLAHLEEDALIRWVEGVNADRLGAES
ncbi:FMN-binding negative transcriptional regulator [Sphingomonas sp. NPDC092331]|uniref:FMN-binding negative transcriptional regulator n=1 Tax=unclassified Sphingomonas TaxID=196159 RepID=UPI0029F0E6B4|nr:FMN-binding negative transcriptional regulator [Pseudomonadota bacterium]